MEEKKISIDELERMLDSLDEETEEDKKRDAFEDKVYHIVLDLIKRSASTLWISNNESARLDAKHTISQCLDILKYWDIPEE